MSEGTVSPVDAPGAVAGSRTVALADLPSLVGVELGPSEWVPITTERIRLFADATDDHQWIHVDEERAQQGPFGGTVAHGFLTLSLIAPLTGMLLHVPDAGAAVNYGLDRVRFVSPVRSNTRVRMTAVIDEVAEIPGGFQVAAAVTIAGEGIEKPAVVARTLLRFLA